MRKHTIGGVLILFMLIVLTGCSEFKSADCPSDNPYSRESVNYRSEAHSFGLGRSDDIDVALKYVYESKEISEIYGDSFQISGDSIICQKSEGHSFFLSNIYTGEAIYEFILGDERYKVSLSKSYFGKWIVDYCESIDVQKKF